ncbi:MAG: DUF2059 domain-containing protein [Rhizobacter sp.]
MKSLLLAFTLAVLSGAGWAQAPSDPSLERLLAVTQAERLNDSVIAQVKASLKPMMAKALEGQTLDAEQRAQADELINRLAARTEIILAEELAWERMKSFNLQVYREAFTQREVDDLIAFYESPTGRAFVDKMPLVMAKTMGLMQERMGPLMARLQAAAAETAREFTEQQRTRKGAVPM